MRELERRGYRALSRLGSGATATVYCVRSLRDGGDFACKAGAAGGLSRREAELLSRLEHPAFPRFREYWESGGQSFLIMEYLMGVSLQRYLERRGRAEAGTAVRIGLELAEALLYLHRRTPAVLYRDLKPCHVILQADGRARLLDLGAACLWEESGRSRAGTPGYAAPEQLAEGKGAAPASDVYALGRLLHFLLTGKDPALPPEAQGPVRRYVRNVPPGLSGAVERCLERDAGERIPDMRRLISLLAPYGEAGRGKLFFPPRNFRAAGERFIVRYEKNILKTSGTSSGWD